MSTPQDIRNARRFAQAQVRLDASEPRSFAWSMEDEDEDNEARMDNAIEVAREQVLATPAAVSGALDVLCDPAWSPNSQPREFPGREVHDVASLCAGLFKGYVVDCQNLQPHQLLAILFCGEDRHALAALTELRCRVADELAGVIRERAAELIREAL